MHWILQPNFFNESAYETVLQVLERFNISYSIEKWIPIFHVFEHEPQLPSKNVMCMGTYALRQAAQERGWYPGVFDLEPFDFTVQLKHWGNHMLNADADVMAFKDVQFLSAAFLRPLQDSKVFDGKVYHQEDFMKWQHDVCVKGEKANGSSLTPDTPVQVCYPKTIHAEYRFWVVKGEIVTASMYRRSKQVFYSSEVDECYHDFVRARIAEWMPLETFVIDVCSIPGTGEGRHDIKIVEINTLNSAGYYAADIQKLIMALHMGYSDEIR
jgi:hypothetical protein